MEGRTPPRPRPHPGLGGVPGRRTCPRGGRGTRGACGTPPPTADPPRHRVSASSWCSRGWPSLPAPPPDHFRALDTKATRSGEFGSIRLNSLARLSGDDTRRPSREGRARPRPPHPHPACPHEGGACGRGPPGPRLPPTPPRGAGLRQGSPRSPRGRVSAADSAAPPGRSGEAAPWEAHPAAPRPPPPRPSPATPGPAWTSPPRCFATRRESRRDPVVRTRAPCPRQETRRGHPDSRARRGAPRTAAGPACSHPAPRAGDTPATPTLTWPWLKKSRAPEHMSSRASVCLFWDMYLRQRTGGRGQSRPATSGQRLEVTGTRARWQ